MDIETTLRTIVRVLALSAVTRTAAYAHASGAPAEGFSPDALAGAFRVRGGAPDVDAPLALAPVAPIDAHTHDASCGPDPQLTDRSVSAPAA